MTTYTPINALHLSEAADLYSVTRSDNNNNWNYIDSLVCLNAYDQATNPDPATDDEDLGYSIGSLWFNTTDDKVWLCTDATDGAAVWRLQLEDGNPGPLLANWDVGAFKITADTFTSDVAVGTPPFTATSTTECTNLNAAKVGGKAAGDFVQEGENGDIGAFSLTAANFVSDVAVGTSPYACTSTTANTNLNADLLDGSHAAAFLPVAAYTADDVFVVGTGAGTYESLSLANTKTLLGVGAGGAAFWTTMPGTPTRVSDTSFTITDTGNASLYDLAFKLGTVLKWEKDGGGTQFAMVTVSSYAANDVTFTIVGNDLAANFTGMKYCIHRAVIDTFIVPGTLPGNTVTTDIAKTIYAPYPLYMFAALVRYKTASTTTGGVWDINDDGSTIFTTKPPIAATATKGTLTVCDCLLDTATTAVAEDSAITLDYDSGHATTPGSDAYVMVYWMPVAWRYVS